jgi:hypothetical protein
MLSLVHGWQSDIRGKGNSERFWENTPARSSGSLLGRVQDQEMAVYEIDPLRDPRWAEFVNRHPRAAIFHTSGWLEALRRTYDYEPVAYTTSPPGQALTNGIPFCRIRTWLTGRRLVSLPFSDHCAPLVDRSEELDSLLASLERDSGIGAWQYVEIRPGNFPMPDRADFKKTETFCLHTLDLRPSLEELFHSFHKDSVQRKIRRAEREGLTCDEGNTDSLLEKFYGLLLRTRRRQGLPPQPMQWFRNLIVCLGDKVKIRVASKDGCAISSILTLTHNKELVYKYGCSDERFNNLGGTQLLFWKAIEEAKQGELEEFDLGRSDLANTGLITFKDRWGSARSTLVYYRHSLRHSEKIVRTWQLNLARHFFAHMPDSFLAAAGRLLYKHIG